MKQPKIENAPGLVWRKVKHGWQARWRARTDLAAKGFEPKNRRLWVSTAAQPEPPEAAIIDIQDQCNHLQSEMLAWGHGGLPINVCFTGTVASLALCYQSDPDSRYHKVRFHTRGFYDRLCSRIIKDNGDLQLSGIKARHLLRWHEDLCRGGKISMAHSLMGMFRAMVNFGATYLEDAECTRLTGVMHSMRFKQGKAREEALTADQAIAIRAEAHRRGLPSIALAQALQFELMLRQKDVIGEWVPVSEVTPPTEITRGNEKWLRGLRWNEIDKDLTIRHVTSKRQKEIEVNLRNAPMVMEELARFTETPTPGAIVICERTNQPWDAHDFRRRWREIATACGIPKTVRNMDSRAGAITEATNAGAELEHVRHAATHGDISMTQRYSRGSVDKVAGVQVKRVAHRNKSGT